jgi:hypothetical protein
MKMEGKKKEWKKWENEESEWLKDWMLQSRVVLYGESKFEWLLMRVKQIKVASAFLFQGLQKCNLHF